MTQIETRCSDCGMKIVRTERAYWHHVDSLIDLDHVADPKPRPEGRLDG